MLEKETIETDPDALFTQIQSEENVEEGSEKTESEAAVAADEAKIKVGDAEYTAQELADAIATSSQAKELERGSREKFDEAAAMRKDVEAKEAELADMRTIWDAWQNGGPNERAKIVEALGMEAGVTVSAPVEDVNEADMTKEELFLYRKYQASEAQVQQMAGILREIAPTLESLKTFTESQKADAQTQADIKAVKDKYGVDLAPAQVKDMRKAASEGPVALMEFFHPFIQAGIKTGADKVRGQGKDEIPSGSTANTFDSEDPALRNDPDEMLRLLQKGYTDIRA